MISVSLSAAGILDELTADLNVGDSRNMDCGSSYLPVHVECLQRSGLGLHYSVAHYYESNGDLVPDPDVVFLRREDGSFCPVSFQNSIAFREAVRWLDDGTIEVDTREQASLVEFANLFIKNIAEQQGIGGRR